VAGGVALAGLAAGGLALARNGKKSKGFPMPKVSAPSLPKPNLSKVRGGNGKATRKALGKTAKALGDAAVEVGKAGYRVGELTNEVRRVREQAKGDH
jgi:hypothetical protein